MAKNFTVRLTGLAATGVEVDAALLRDVLHFAVEGSRRAVRLRVAGRSTAPAPAPRWLSDAAAVRFQRIDSGSSCVQLTAGSLAEQAPERFGQLDMFMLPTEPTRTGLDLLGESLHDALTQNLNSDYLDRGLLSCFSDLRRVFAHGVDTVEFASEGRPLIVRDPDVAIFESIADRIPQSQLVRVAGVLDSIKASSRSFEIRIGDGVARCVFAADQFADFKRLLGERVVVSGEGEFKASGVLRQMHARALAPATGADDAIWSSIPRHLDSPLHTRELHRPAGVGRHHVVAKVFGQWPGEESDDELDAAMKEFF